jgi:serine protease Do
VLDLFMQIELGNKIKETVAGIILLLLITGGAFYVYKNEEQKREQQVASAEISTLQKQVSELQQKLGTVSADQKTLSDSQKVLTDKESENRQVIHEKSQDQLLTEAVAKVSPSVVSIVISKEVPNLTVTYENPFGNDPFFKDFGYQVPVYHQNGSTLQKVGAGTGFIITADGYILTNRHVVSDQSAQYTALLSDGSKKEAQVIYVDPNNDVAIVKIEGKFKPVTLADSSTLQLGQSVIAIGNALGEYNNSVSVGIVSGLNRSITASGNGSSEDLTGVIQTDAAINPGNSGGPLLDLSGKVMGINVATVQGSSNISFSIPINTVKSLIKQIIGK